MQIMSLKTTIKISLPTGLLMPPFLCKTFFTVKKVGMIDYSIDLAWVFHWFSM